MNDPLDEFLVEFPPRRSDNLLPLICEAAQWSGKCVVVLDDDPTGTQTVYNTPVLTTWDVGSLAEQLGCGDPMFYVLTNSRALPERDAVELAYQIGRNLVEASSQTGRGFTVISRSDSTLRGHYPAEVDAVAQAIGHPDAIHVIMPFFLQGGRLTFNDIHYVWDGDVLTPVAETPFARDATFGFRHSNLREWVVEKQASSFELSRLHSIGLTELRREDPDALGARLASLPPRSVLVVNAVDITDAHAFALAARRAEQLGIDFIYRTAASFVQAYAGLSGRPLLRPDEMIESDHRAGLIVVGSYVPKTTGQLKHLLAMESPPSAVVLEVDTLLGESGPDHLVDTIRTVNQLLGLGKDVVLHTSRGLVTGQDGDESLRIGTTVSRAVVDVVRAVDVPLRFLIAKGGITSSDIATKALEVKRANVLGQILLGVPVWSLGPGSRLPDLPYVVFPGNVGGEDALTQAYQKLKA